MLLERYRALIRHPLRGRMTRFAISSAFAALTSAVVFSILYVLGASTTACSVIAFFAGWTNDVVRSSIPAHHGVRVLLVTGSYFAVLAMLYGVRFFLYEHWIFSGRSRVRAAFRSRRQVWSAARANRTP